MKERFFKLWTTGRGLYVLLGLLTFGIFIAPWLIAVGLISDVLVEFVFALILLAGVFTTPCSITLRVGMLLIAFLAVITRSLDKFKHTNLTIASADNILAVITILAFTILIVQNFLLSKALLRYRITAAVAIYLVFGILWARLYEIVYLFDSAAFSLNEQINPFSLLYFSFVTLITLGYGDIVPVSVAARSLAILEGVIGQLYIVILISSLVAEFSNSAMKSANKDNMH